MHQNQSQHQNYQTKNSFEKWTREKYKEIMKAYYYAKYHPSDENNTKQRYTIWTKINFNNRQ